MFVLRGIALLALLFVLVLGVAYLVTRDRKYLRIAAKTLLILVVVGVAFGLLYIFERVLRFL